MDKDRKIQLEKGYLKVDQDRDKVGKIARDILLKGESFDPINQMEEQLKDYNDNLWVAVNNGKNNFTGNFFIVVLTKKEKLMHNVIRNYFFPRFTCPTPDYDQTVYFYNFKDDNLDYIWTIPSKDTCLYLRDNALLVADEEKELLNFVLDFDDGTLFKLCKKLNGEQRSGMLLEN